MRNSTSAFDAEVKKPSRTFRAKIVCGNETITDAIRLMTISAGSCGSEGFTLGASFSGVATVSAYGDLTRLAGKELQLYIGLIVDGEPEYIRMGYFTAKPSDMGRSKDATTFTAYDRVTSVCDAIPYSETPATVGEALESLRTATGLTIRLSGLPESVKDAAIVAEASEGTPTCRTMLGQVALACGGFVYADADGAIVIAAYPTTATDTIDADRLTDALSVSFAAEPGYDYTAGTVSFLGDPRWTPEDAASVTTDAGTFLIPCMQIDHAFDGGLTTIITAPGALASDNVGPTQKAAEFALETAVEASKTATNYVAVDSTGLMVANMEGEKETPSTATGRNVFIDSDSVDIRDGQTVVASFGESGISFNTDTPVTIGTDSSYIKYKDEKIQIKADSITLGSSNVATAISDAKKAGTDAQSTANTAKTNAATAQSTADTAKSNAAAAQSTADTAKANAATAQSTATAAAKTATNYISVDSTGLMVADMSAGAQTPSTATGRNVLIKSDSVKIRNGKTELASFGTDIQLGQSSGEYAKLTSEGLRLYNGNANVASFINTGVTLYASGTSMVNINATDGIRVGKSDSSRMTLTSDALRLYADNTLKISMSASAIRVGEEGDGKRNVRVTSDSVAIRENTTNIANFGSAITIGKTGNGNRNVYIDTDGLHIRDNNTDVAKFSSDVILGKTTGDNITITSNALNFNHGSDWVVRVSSANSDDIRMESTNEIRVFKEGGAGFVHQYGNGAAASSHVVKFGIKDISGTKRKGIEDYTNAKSTWLLYWDGADPTYGTVGTSLRTSGEFRSTYGDLGLIHTHTNGKSLGFGVGGGGTNRGMYDRTNGKWLFYTSSDTAADVTANAPLFVNGRIRSGENEDAYQLGANTSVTSSTAKSIPNNAWTDANTLKIHRGAWLITGEVKFASAANKRRGVRIAYGSGKSVFEASSMVVGASTTSQTIYVNTTIHGRWSADTTLYLQAYQDTGSALNVTYSTIKATFLGYY